MRCADADAPDLFPHLVRHRPGNPQLHQLRIPKHGIQGRAQLVGHDRQKFRLGLAGCLRLETCLPLISQLLRPLLSLLAIGDIPQRDNLHLLVIPLRLHHPQLGVHHAPAPALDDVDLGGFADHDWKPKGGADQVLGRTVEQPLGRRIGEADRPLPVDDDYPVGQALDYGPQARLAGT